MTLRLLIDHVETPIGVLALVADEDGQRLARQRVRLRLGRRRRERALEVEVEV